MQRLCFILVVHITSNEGTGYVYVERLQLFLTVVYHVFTFNVNLESREQIFFPCILRMLSREYRWV